MDKLIENDGELPLYGIRVLGETNKDADQIGKFGTGLKEAIAFLARLGSLPVIFSGTNRIDFCTKTTHGGIEEIHFKLSKQIDEFRKNHWHRLGISPGLGERYWKDAWYIFREFLCNAKDENGDKPITQLTQDGDSLQGREGKTRVYIPITPVTLAAHELAQERLLFLDEDLGDRLVSDKSGRLVYSKKHEKTSAQIYCRGIWIKSRNKEVRGLESFYDYDFPNIELTESRTADWDDVDQLMANAICELPYDACLMMLKAFLESEKDYEEKYCLNSGNEASYYDLKNWKDAFVDLYGESTCICKDYNEIQSRLDDAGITYVVIPSDELYKFLKKVGINTPKECLSESQLEIGDSRDVTPAVEKKVNEIWDRLDFESPLPTISLFNDSADSSEPYLFDSEELMVISEGPIDNDWVVDVLSVLMLWGFKCKTNSSYGYVSYSHGSIDRFILVKLAISLNLLKVEINT